MERSRPRRSTSALSLRASLGLCGVSIITIPSEVVTIPWFEPRSSVSTNTLAVSCFMGSPPASGESHRTGYGIVGPSASPSAPNRPVQGRSEAMPYKLLSYQAGRAARAGVLVADTVYDAAKVTGVAGHASVLGILEDWSRARRLLAQAAKRLEAGRGRVKGIPIK